MSAWWSVLGVDRDALERAVSYAEQLVALRPQDAQARQLLDALTAAVRQP